MPRSAGKRHRTRRSLKLHRSPVRLRTRRAHLRKRGRPALRVSSPLFSLQIEIHRDRTSIAIERPLQRLRVLPGGFPGVEDESAQGDATYRANARRESFISALPAKFLSRRIEYSLCLGDLYLLPRDFQPRAAERPIVWPDFARMQWSKVQLLSLLFRIATRDFRSDFRIPDLRRTLIESLTAD